MRLRLSGGPSPIEATQKVAIDAGASQVVRFPIEAIRPGFYQGSVAVAPKDELALDDARWLAFEARSTDRVLLLDGDPGSSVYASETLCYLEIARPAPACGGQSEINGDGVRAGPTGPGRAGAGACPTFGTTGS